MKTLLACGRAARKQGYSTIVEVFAPGMTVMAALGPALIDAPRDIAAAGSASSIFVRRAA